MTSKHDNPRQKTIPFEDPTEMDDQKNLLEADAQVAINMVLDLHEQLKVEEARRKQATYWRLFAGIVLVLVVILSILNYTSRKDQLKLFEDLIQASPLALNEQLVLENNELNKRHLSDQARSLYFYFQLKTDFERRISISTNEGIALTPILIDRMKSFNAIAKAHDLTPIEIPPLTIRP